MPRIARTFIKAGLIYFLAALLAALGFEIESLQFPGMVPLFWHLLMVGWITQIIFGVSIWMFPGRTREEGFWAQKWGWITFGLLNLGLVLRAVSEPMVSLSPGTAWKVLLVISAVVQVLAAIFYTIELWPRILSKQQLREKRKRKRNQKRNQ